MPPAGFEPAIPAGERLQAHALDRSATGTGIKLSFYFAQKHIRVEIMQSVKKVFKMRFTFFASNKKNSQGIIHCGVSLSKELRG